MDAEKVIKIANEAVAEAEREDFERLAQSAAEEGWANPVLRAQNLRQGFDNGFGYGAWAEALKELAQYGEVHGGPSGYDADEDGDVGEWLKSQCGKQLGAGQPVAWIGDAQNSYWVAVCDDATQEEIEAEALDCAGIE